MPYVLKESGFVLGLVLITIGAIASILSLKLIIKKKLIIYLMGMLLMIHLITLKKK